MTDYRLFLVRVFTRQWDEAFVFYRDVLGFEVSFANREMGWAQFKLGPAELALEAADPSDPETQDLVGRFVGVSIEVDNIELVYQSLCDRGVTFTGPPDKQPWGGTLAHFQDLDGNVLTLLGA